jgi:hypothetical protein
MLTVNHRGNFAFVQDGGLFTNLIGTVPESIQVRTDPDNTVAGVAAQFTLDEQIADQTGILFGHAAGRQQVFAKLQELLMMDSRHVETCLLNILRCVCRR